MAEFLSEAWIAELGAAAQTAAPPRSLRLTVQQVVLGSGGVEHAYVIRIADGAISVTPGRADDADLTFTQDRGTAEAIARGETSAQAAFLAGQLKVGGNLAAMLDQVRDLSVLDDVFGPARAGTTW